MEKKKIHYLNCDLLNIYKVLSMYWNFIWDPHERGYFCDVLFVTNSHNIFREFLETAKSIK